MVQKGKVLRYLTFREPQIGNWRTPLKVGSKNLGEEKENEARDLLYHKTQKARTRLEQGTNGGRNLKEKKKIRGGRGKGGTSSIPYEHLLRGGRKRRGEVVGKERAGEKKRSMGVKKVTMKENSGQVAGENLTPGRKMGYEVT